MRNFILAGNWKMNLLRDEAVALAKAVVPVAEQVQPVEVVLGPPMTCAADVIAAVKGSCVGVAAQDCHWETQGAFTGEVSAPMLKDAGFSHVIIGHSERRTLFGETDENCSKKVRAALDAGLVPILCLGETLQQREAGETFKVLQTQLSGSLAGITTEDMRVVVLAYEPVWAIGTGKTATPEIAQQAHACIRGWLVEQYGDEIGNRIQIQYGGSMKPGNAAELLSQPDVDGGLIGGAALKAESFNGILQAAPRS